MPVSLQLRVAVRAVEHGVRNGAIALWADSHSQLQKEMKESEIKESKKGCHPYGKPPLDTKHSLPKCRSNLRVSIFE